jgi:hypothetical protein
VTVYYGIYTCPDLFVSVQETPFTLDEVTTARLWGHSPLLQQSDKTILHTRHDPRAVCLFEVLANNVHKDSTTFKSTRLNRSIFCFVSVMLWYDHYTLRFTFPHTHTHTTDASLSGMIACSFRFIDYITLLGSSLLLYGTWNPGALYKPPPPTREWTTESFNGFCFKKYS